MTLRKYQVIAQQRLERSAPLAIQRGSLLRALQRPQPAQQREGPQRRTIILRAGPFGDVERRIRIDACICGHSLVTDLCELGIRAQVALKLWRYVLPPVGEDIPPLPEAVAAFKEALAEARAAEDRLREVLTEGGWLK